MDVKNGPGGDDYQNKGAAIFVEGEELYEGLRRRRIHLCREESGAGRSSSVYCRRAQGVPFKWEKKPGTPTPDVHTQLIPNEIINIPPLSPPPSLQGLGLPLPCFHHHTDTQQHYVFSWRKIKKMLRKQLQQAEIIIIGKKSSSSGGGGGGGLQQDQDQDQEEHKSTTHHQRENVGVGDSDTDFIASLHNSSSSSSSSSSCSNAPFCYGSSWNMQKAIMDEEAGKKKNNNNNSSRYYSKEPPRHKAFFRLEEEGEEDGYGFRSLLSRLISSSSSVVEAESSRFYYCMSTAKGIIPFQWEIQPGAPKVPPGNDLVIPPPAPPPLAQSLALPKPHRQSQTAISYSPWTKLWKGGNKRLMAAARKKLSWIKR